jgi:HAMP domain-containing protein
MNTEQIDGSIITELYTDEAGRTWHICRRKHGSMALYATRPDMIAQYIIYDTLDNQPPHAQAREMLDRIGRVADEVNRLRDLAIEDTANALREQA